MTNSYKLFIPVVCIFQACSINTYINNSQNTPAFEEKGELVSTGLMDFQSAEFQTAYSVNSHLGITINMYGGLQMRQAAKYNNQKTNFIEGGLGYFSKINNSKTSIEIFAGYGHGVFNGRYFKSKELLKEGYEDIILDIDYNRFYTQSIIWFKESELALIGFSARFTYSNYNDYKYIYDAYVYGGYIHSSHEIQNFQFYSIDPLLFVQYGWKDVKFFFQVGFSIPFGKEIRYIRDDPIGYHPLYKEVTGNFGINYKFSVIELFND